MNKFKDDIDQLASSNAFDATWYIHRYPDVVKSGMTPAEHYIRIGQRIGRKPNGRVELIRQQREVPTSSEVPHRPARESPPEGGDANPYGQYAMQIFAKLDALPRENWPINVEIDTDYTGPARGTAFDSFYSAREREVSIRQTIRMLKLGIVAVNPGPGIHAARQANGDFVRYPSIETAGERIERVPSSMLIHIHAFYPDVLEEILDQFVGAAQQARYLITTTTQKNHDTVKRIVERRTFLKAKVMRTENVGRDVGPLLDHVIDRANDEDVICHVHTKKSPDVGGRYGEKWRKSLYGTLLTQTAIDAFDDPKLGLLFPDFSRSVGWGKNRILCEAIAKKLGESLREHPGPFPIGNMFLVRAEVAKMMRKATKGTQWPREPVPYDGSMLHAVERMWPLACECSGMTWSAIHSRSTA